MREERTGGGPCPLKPTPQNQLSPACATLGADVATCSVASPFLGSAVLPLPRLQCSVRIPWLPPLPGRHSVPSALGLRKRLETSWRAAGCQGGAERARAGPRE